MNFAAERKGLEEAACAGRFRLDVGSAFLSSTSIVRVCRELKCNVAEVYSAHGMSELERELEGEGLDKISAASESQESGSRSREVRGFPPPPR